MSYERGSVAVPGSPPPDAAIARPGGIEPLPAVGDAAAVASDATWRPASEVRAAHVVEIKVVGDLGPNAGIAAFCPASGASYAWRRLADLTEAARGSQEFALELPSTEVALTIAASRAEARHRYLTRIDLPAAASRPSRTRFDVTLDTTRLLLAEGAASAGPFRLVRVGDPDWRGPTALAAGLFLPRDERLLLGAGDYELVDPMDSDNRQRFAVPAQAPVTIDPRLAQPRTARR